MNSSTASPTYRMHWGLTETPFRGGIDPKFFYESPTHEEALARLQFLVEERQRLGLLMGETGTGKSMLLEVVARQLRRGGSQVANHQLLGADLREFLWLIAAELGLNPGGRDDVFRLWRCILDRLAENRYQQLDTVLLFDDAHEASREVLEHVAPAGASRSRAERAGDRGAVAGAAGMRRRSMPGCWSCSTCGSISTLGKNPTRSAISIGRWPKPAARRPPSAKRR